MYLNSVNRYRYDIGIGVDMKQEAGAGREIGVVQFQSRTPYATRSLLPAVATDGLSYRDSTACCQLPYRKMDRLCETDDSPLKRRSHLILWSATVEGVH